MPKAQPATIAEYIANAPEAGRPHLRRLYAILKEVAPEAEEAIKWGAPFFIEPRFLFSFAANKAHCNFAPSEEALTHFHDALRPYKTTKNYLQLPYDEPLPEDLIRMIAAHRVEVLRQRHDDSFW